MILNELNRLRDANNAIRKLYLSDDLAIHQNDIFCHIDVRLVDFMDEQRLVVCHANGGHATYFLPWQGNSGLYLDLPKHAHQVLSFLTAELSGCFVGVQDLGDVYRVRHYNFPVESFDVNDLRRYDNNHLAHWLVPAYTNVVQKLSLTDIPHETYPRVEHDQTTVFWGEYVGNNWEFYYQLPNKRIFRFLVH